jgi:hypothetical protein
VARKVVPLQDAAVTLLTGRQLVLQLVRGIPVVLPTHQVGRQYTCVGVVAKSSTGTGTSVRCWALLPASAAAVSQHGD